MISDHRQLMLELLRIESTPPPPGRDRLRPMLLDDD